MRQKTKEVLETKKAKTTKKEDILTDEQVQLSSSLYIRMRDKKELIAGWARYGLTNDRIAKNLGVALCTFTKYLKEYPELQDALDEGRFHSDIMVENALFKKAIGFQYDEVTRELRYNKDTEEYEMAETKRVTKYVAPDTSAATYWLERRQGERWKQKVTEGVSVEAINEALMSVAQLIMSPVKERKPGDESLGTNEPDDLEEDDEI